MEMECPRCGERMMAEYRWVESRRGWLWVWSCQTCRHVVVIEN